MSKKIYLIAGILAIFLLAGAGCGKTTVTKTPLQKQTQGVTQKGTTQTSVPTPVTQKSQETKLADNCDIFPDKLSSCEKYRCQFAHEFTGETLEKEILGIINGKCDYVEQMPNGGKMECKYTESARKAIAQYYKDVAAAESVGMQVNINLRSGEQKSTYTIDDKKVENPLEEAMNNGTCVLSGY